MADYTAQIAPFINVQFYVTSIFGNTGTRIHRGIDIATPSSLGNVPVYSMCEGTVYYKGYDEGGYGNYLIMKDRFTGMGFLYGHLDQPTPLNVGDTIQVGQFVGYEGTTGASTGIHLHVEMQDLSHREWQYQAPLGTYENPALFMGFPNTEGISVIYNGTPIIVVTPIKQKRFPWVVLARKIRQKRNHLTKF